MSITSFNVSYPDFQLGDIINPDELDVNFSDIMIRLNQVIDVLNQITDGINGDGATIIDIAEISPFLSPNLQAFLEELVTQLQSDTTGSGAEFIGSLPIVGVTGTTVHEQLLSLKTMLDTLNNSLLSEVARLDTRVDTTDANVTAVTNQAGTLEVRMTQAEADLGAKADVADVYLKVDSDQNNSDLEQTIYGNVYQKSEVDTLLDGKVSEGENHTGSWQGIDVEDIANVVGAKDVVIANTQPTTPSEGMLWFNPTNHQYTLFLGGQWRVNGTPMRVRKVANRVTLGADSTTVVHGLTNFDPEYDAVMVFLNSIYVDENDEYTLSADGASIVTTAVDGTTGNPIPWVAGTVFDFVAFVSEAVTGINGSSRIADLEARITALENA